MKYIIKKIQEADFGCEERPGGCGAMDSIRICDIEGRELEMEVPDADLLTQNINEGDWVYFDKENNIYKEI